MCQDVEGSQYAVVDDARFEFVVCFPDVIVIAVGYAAIYDLLNAYLPDLVAL